jgi:hypothetical protein
MNIFFANSLIGTIATPSMQLRGLRDAMAKGWQAIPRLAL